MNLKKLLPVENYVLTTKLSADEVRKRLAAHTEPNQKLNAAAFNRTYTRAYSGEINGNLFTISRNINYRNSFLPVIKGVITGLPGQTSVQISMRAEPFVEVFMAVWLGFVGLTCIGF